MYRGDENLYTLGPVAVRWMQGWLAIPDGPKAGEPLRLSRRQIRFVCEANLFEHDEGQFRRVHRRAFYVGAKSEGKTPLVAGLGAFRFRGPAVPYDVDDNGFLVGREDPAALVQIFANSELQGLRTTWRPLISMMKNGRLSGDKRLKAMDTMCRYEDRLITYDPLTMESAEGTRTGAAIIEESQYMRSRSRRDAAAAVVRNVGKTDGVVLFPTNAPERGGGSYADIAIKAAESGEDESTYVMYPKLKARIEDIKGKENKPAVLEGLAQIYGEAADRESDPGGWVDPENMYKDMMVTTERKARRYWLNESTASEGKVVENPASIESWGRPGQKIPDGSFVALGFDGSESDDATALVAVSLTDPPHVETLGIWGADATQRKEGWRIPKAEVKSAFLEAKKRFKVEIVVGDPSIFWKAFFSDLADDWGYLSPLNVGDRSKRSGWGLVCEVWMNSGNGKLAEVVLSNFLDTIETYDEDGELEIGFTHDGDETLVKHILSMVRIKKGRYETVAKESDAFEDQNDAGVAVMLGLWAAAQFPQGGSSGDDEKPADGGGSSYQDKLSKRLGGR